MIGELSYSVNRLVLMATALRLLLALCLLFYRTCYGVITGATIGAPRMARVLGVDIERIYGLTFGLGAFLAGLSGGLYAPTMTMAPTIGATFIVESFVTVVVGGAYWSDRITLPFEPFIGTIGASPEIETTSSLQPDYYGGNMDLPDVGPGR